MLIRYVLFLVNVLVRAFEKTIDWIVDVTDSIWRIGGPRNVVRLIFAALGWVDRLLFVGNRYLKQVRRSLQYRLHFESVVRPMRNYYRELKRK